jgi:Wax ester synthase-like Acyl-CoA acyltransferase domain
VESMRTPLRCQVATPLIGSATSWPYGSRRYASSGQSWPTAQLNLEYPVWGDDDAFDLDRHQFRIGLPPPGACRELAEIWDIAVQPRAACRPRVLGVLGFPECLRACRGEPAPTAEE